MKRKRIFSIILIVTMLVSILPPMSAKATSTTTITVGQYLKRILTALDIPVSTTDKTPYVTKALEIELVKKGEYSKYSVPITKEDAAVILSRAAKKQGITYDVTLYEYVKEYKRIYDIKKADSSKRTAIYQVYTMGLMIGDSRGNFTQDRSFQPKALLTLTEAKNTVKKLKEKSKRSKLSPDGQVIRTTKLPSNYKKYPYILEAFPNDFYEMKFKYNFVTYYYTPVELKDYASPAVVRNMILRNGRTELSAEESKKAFDTYVPIWAERIKKNLQYRFNVNYKTIGDKWVNNLLNSYVLTNSTSDYNTDLLKDIKAYVSRMKKNKTIIKTDKIVVEPSTLYKDDALYMRAYVKYKIVSANSLGTKRNEAIVSKDLIYSYADVTEFINPKRGIWIESYFDIPIGIAALGQTLDERSVMRDNSLSEWLQKGKID